MPSIKSFWGYLGSVSVLLALDGAPAVPGLLELPSCAGRGMRRVPGRALHPGWF